MTKTRAAGVPRICQDCGSRMQPDIPEQWDEQARVFVGGVACTNCKAMRIYRRTPAKPPRRPRLTQASLFPEE